MAASSDGWSASIWDNGALGPISAATMTNLFSATQEICPTGRPRRSVRFQTFGSPGADETSTSIKVSSPRWADYASPSAQRYVDRPASDHLTTRYHGLAL